MEYLSNAKKSYELKVDSMIVKIEYSENNKKFDECMLNILKQKMK